MTGGANQGRSATAGVETPGGSFAETGTVSGPAAANAFPPASRGEAERRQLTVLFCDLVGSTQLSEGLDEEAFRDVLLAYYEAATAVSDSYEGYVAQRLGDGLLIYFGYPAAHDEDAERAVRCGYDMVAAVGRLDVQPPLAVRIGIHTGPVVVGDTGGSTDVLALGATVNLAARLQSLAPINTVVISETTFRLVPGMFVTRDLGTPELKGISRPVRVHQVIQPSGVRTRLEAADQLTPYVGRDAERALLAERWRQAVAGDGQACLISAEPGLGKSRLLLMLRQQIEGVAHSWLECRASPLTRNRAYQPIIELMYRGLVMKYSDSNALKLQRLEQGLDAIGADRQESVPLLAPLLGIDLAAPYVASSLGPELKRRKTLGLLGSWLLALAAAQPLLLVLEDLHWADASTLNLIGWLLERLPGRKLMVVMTSRPEFTASWPPREYLTPLTLQPLKAHETERMLDSLTGSLALPAGVQEQIIERANGVPLFIEEITKQLLESGQLRLGQGRLELAGSLDALAIPATLQDSLMARLDRLGGAKDVAQVAAVIGREIPYGLLCRVVEMEDARLQAGLDKLTGAGLLYQRGQPPEASYLFKHALIQDTAYNSLLKSRRQKLHAMIARAIESSLPERARNEPEILAIHFEKAGDALEAARWYSLAGDVAFRSDVKEAIRQWRAAIVHLRALDNDEAARIRVRSMASLVRYGARAGMDPEESLRLYTEAAAAAERLGDLRQLARVTFGYGSSLFWCQGAVQDTYEYFERSARYADQTGDPAMRAAHWSGVAWCGSFTGAVPPILRIVGEVEGLCGGDAAFGAGFLAWSPLSCAAMAKAESLRLLGRPGEARAALDEMVERALRRAEFELAAWAVSSIWPRIARGEADLMESLEAVRETARSVEASGNLAQLVVAHGGMGYALIELGRHGEAAAVLQQALGEARGQRTGLFEEARLLVDLARARLGLGDSDGAGAIAREAVGVARRQRSERLECLALLTRARVSRACKGAPGEVDADLAAALVLARRIGALLYEGEIEAEMGRESGGG